MTTKRFKIFQKIAQAAETTTTSTAPSTISGSPSSITTDIFPTFVKAWGANFIEPANELLEVLNWAIFALSAGQHDFAKMKSNNFTSDATKYDDFTGAVIKFSGDVFRDLFNAGKPFQTIAGNKKQVIDGLLSKLSQISAIPDTLSNVFPQSFLQTKVGNFKPKVISILTQMNALTGSQ